MILADPDDATNSVLKVWKGQNWWGNTLTTWPSIDLSATASGISMKVHSNKAGTVPMVKVIGAAGSNQAIVTTTVANAWETLRYNFSGYNAADTYTRVEIYVNTRTDGTDSPIDPDFVIYVDGITLYDITGNSPYANTNIGTITYDLASSTVSLVNTKEFYLEYKVDLGHGHATPVIAAEATVNSIQPTGVNGTAIIVVRAEDNLSSATYKSKFTLVSEPLEAASDPVVANLDNANLNPVSSHIQVSFVGKKANFRIYNTLGAIVVRESNIASQTQIRTSHLEHAVYLVRLVVNSKIYSHQLVIE